MTFFHTKTNEIREAYFYIPIVEQIKENAPNWALAKQEQRIRKFYNSADSLERAESARLPPGRLLACYKVILSDSERQQLTASNTQGTAFSGFLHFKTEEILSLILFKPDNQLELTNPHYLQETDKALAFGV